MARPFQNGTRPTDGTDELAAEMRQRMTTVERILWSELRANKIEGFKFRRQHALGPYIADFYCHEAALVVEIDSDWHEFVLRRAHDLARDEWMRARNIETLRVSARGVTYNRSGVVARIRAALLERAGKSQSVRAASPATGGGGQT